MADGDRIGSPWTLGNDGAATTIVLPAHDIAAGSRIVVWCRFETGDRFVSITDSVTGAGNWRVQKRHNSNIGAGMGFCYDHPGGTGVVITITFSDLVNYRYATAAEYEAADAATDPFEAWFNSASNPLSFTETVTSATDTFAAQSSYSGSTFAATSPATMLYTATYHAHSEQLGQTGTTRTHAHTGGSGNQANLLLVLKRPTGGGAQTLLPPLTTRTRTVYAPTVAPGAVTLSPPLTTRTRTVYSPTVSPGAVTLQPPLTTRSRTIYAPTVTVGAVTLLPPLVTRTRVVYEPVVSQPGGDAQDLLPPLTTRTRTIYAPTVVPGPITISPPLTTRSRTIYAPTVIPGDVDLLPPLVTRGRTVYAPTVTTLNTLLPPLTTRSRSIYAPTVAVGAVTLFPPLVTRSRAVYPPEVEGGIPVVATGGMFLPLVRRRRR